MSKRDNPYRKGDFAFDPWQAPEHRRLGDYLPRTKWHEIVIDPRPQVMKEKPKPRP